MVNMVNYTLKQIICSLTTTGQVQIGRSHMTATQIKYWKDFPEAAVFDDIYSQYNYHTISYQMFVWYLSSGSLFNTMYTYVYNRMQ